MFIDLESYLFTLGHFRTFLNLVLNLTRMSTNIFSILRTSGNLTWLILRHLFWILLDLEVQSHISATLCALETRVVSSRKRFISCNLHLAEQPHGIVQRNESWSECSYFLASRYLHPIEFSLLHLLSDVRVLEKERKIWRWNTPCFVYFWYFSVDSCLDNLYKKFKILSLKTSLFCNLAITL